MIGTNPNNDRTLSCNLGSIGRGNSAIKTITFRTLASASTKTARVASGSVSDTASFTIPATAAADLSLARTSGPTLSNGKYNITYRITNNGDATATSVRLTAPLTAGQFDSGPGCSLTGTIPGGSRSLTCTIANINAGSARTITLKFNPTRSFLSVDATANATGTTSNTISRTIPAGTINLDLTATGPTQSGANWTFRFTATNNGNISAPATTLTIPINTSQLADTPSGCSLIGTNPNNDRTLSCNLGSIGRGNSAIKTITPNTGIGVNQNGPSSQRQRQRYRVIHHPRHCGR